MFKTNIILAITCILAFLIFILFFTVEKKDIGKNITEKYQNTVILSEKNTNATQIVFFSVGKTKIGIANYVKAPLLDRYYCQESYILDNVEEQPIINDVMKGGWQGYLIEATPEAVKIQKNVPRYGVYWYIVCISYFIFVIEAILFYRRKKRALKISCK